METDPKTIIDDQEEFPGMESQPDDSEFEDGVDERSSNNNHPNFESWEIEGGSDEHDPHELQDGK